MDRFQDAGATVSGTDDGSGVVEFVITRIPTGHMSKMTKVDSLDALSTCPSEGLLDNLHSSSDTEDGSPFSPSCGPVMLHELSGENVANHTYSDLAARELGFHSPDRVLEHIAEAEQNVEQAPLASANISFLGDCYGGPLRRVPRYHNLAELDDLYGGPLNR